MHSATMEDYDDLRNDMPPPDAMGDDRPSDNEDMLDDTAKEFQDPKPASDPVADDSDDESLLSEVDEAQFADFDPSAVQVAPDFESLKAIKAKRRDRTGEDPAKKKKERTREKVKQNRRRRDSDEGFELGGAEVDGKRVRKSKAGESGERKKPVRVEVDEDTLPPEERRRRALDRAMDAAIKKSSGVRRKKGGDIVWLYTQMLKVMANHE